MNNKPNTSGSGKKFYASLFCAAALMIVMGVIGMQVSKGGENSDGDLAKSGEQNNGQEMASNNSGSENTDVKSPSITEVPSTDSQKEADNSASDNFQLSQGTELEDFSLSPDEGGKEDADNENENTKAVFSNESKPLKEQKKKEKKKEDKDEKTDENAAEETFGVANLVFPEEDGLLWPITGDILLNYSMDKGVYFKTLGQYKCNPALLIQGSEGDEVLSSSNGTVQSILEDAETGLTVTMSVGDSSAGNHYEVVYGQLDNLKIAEGEMVSAGQVIGTIAQPTKYYVSEGTHLYYKVLMDGEPTNPLLLLQ